MVTIQKAVVAAVGSAVTALTIGLGTALVDDGSLTTPEIGVAIGGALLAAGAVGRATWSAPYEVPKP